MRKWLTIAILLLFVSTAWSADLLSPRNKVDNLNNSSHIFKRGYFTNISIGGVDYTWPAADGTAGYTLVTDGSKNLSWSSASAPAWDNIAAPDANKTIAFTTYSSTFTSTKTNGDMFTIEGLGNFGDYAVLHVKSSTGNPTNGTILQVTSHDTDADAMLVTANSVNVVRVNGAGTLTITGATGITGDVTITGNLSQTGTFYQSALAAAAAGNVNLTVDAAGNGTITVGGVSTGNTIFPGVVQFNGNTTLGNAATDTITLTGIVNSNLTLDDGVTDSPSLIFKDATDQTVTIKKTDGADLNITGSAATQSVYIAVGNLKVGNGSPGTAAMDGDDAYIKGQLEVDGAAQFDGAVTAASTLGVTSTLTTSANVTHTLGAANKIVIDGDTTDQTNTAGALDIDVGTITNGASAINSKMTYTTGGVGESAYNIKLDIDDDTGSAGYLYGLYVDSSDAVGSSEVIGIYTGTSLDTGLKQLVGAAATAISTDANTTDSTSTTGVWLLDVGTITNGNIGQLIDYNVGDTGAGVTATALKIDLDDDTSSNAATINGLWVNASDTTGHANTVVRGLYISGAGLEAGIQVDTGYVRIGTGSTPDVTPGDDDLYVEGTIEVDGAARFDGNISANGTLTMAKALMFMKGGDLASPAGGELTLTDGTYFVVTGTNNITSIAAASSISGRLLILNFAGILTFTDGNNLKLAGNFVTTADDTITLICDGTNWYEMARSVN